MSLDEKEKSYSLIPNDNQIIKVVVPRKVGGECVFKSYNDGIAPYEVRDGKLYGRVLELTSHRGEGPRILERYITDVHTLIMEKAEVFDASLEANIKDLRRS